MDWYAAIKRMYDRKLWTKEMVADGVYAGKLSTEQYEEITGEPYPVAEEPAESSPVEGGAAG
ncbi:XkdX family protein [Planomicrobium sp. CPCC 101079]|uniref:XkdX family protein n=1 Tax=Planomicrobium sp. CPCC 101079 TaxID=2599618 RepID=UPI0011B35CD1|nr:XkdX family protein [Planomicrobium sp. CPCC 101079]TWT04593.1 XkdX family protein [Planomicrobium sp. CPCC 101079]